MYTKKLYFEAKNHLPFSDLWCYQYPLRRKRKRAKNRRFTHGFARDVMGIDSITKGAPPALQQGCPFLLLSVVTKATATLLFLFLLAAWQHTLYFLTPDAFNVTLAAAHGRFPSVPTPDAFHINKPPPPLQSWHYLFQKEKCPPPWFRFLPILLNGAIYYFIFPNLCFQNF